MARSIYDTWADLGGAGGGGGRTPPPPQGFDHLPTDPLPTDPLPTDPLPTDPLPTDPAGPPFDTFSEIHFWPTDPKIFSN